MATNENLIDFSAESPRKTSASISFDQNMPPIVVTTSISSTDHIESVVPTMSTPALEKGGKPNKSLFEITRVESHGESVGGDDSELDDTLSETHDSSSTSILDNLAKHKQDLTPLETLTTPVSKPLTVETSNQSFTSALSSTTSSTSTTPSSHTPSGQISEPPSRFRIVKISKAKPYDKGKWVISDFKDSQKQKDEAIVSENPASPMPKRTGFTSESGGEHKCERTKSVTSPTVTEPVKTKSSEFLMQNVLSTSQSRGSSFNTQILDRTSSQESATTVPTEPLPVPNVVAPVVVALASVLDQIQTIKDHVTTSGETANSLQLENIQLKEENRDLKERLDLLQKQLDNKEKENRDTG